MSTHADGASPSVMPGPGDPDPERPDPDPDPEERPDPGPDWLQQEIQRRIAENASSPGGRHARRDDTDSAIPAPPSAVPELSDGATTPGYLPWPAESTPGPAGFAEPDARPRRRPGSPPRRTTVPALPAGREAAAAVAVPAPRTPDVETLARADAEAPRPRVKVVLAERKGAARPVRTVVDVQELTPVGELLCRNLVGNQIAVALRTGAAAALPIGLLPALFALFPVIGRTEVLGLRLPWLLLGIGVYPFLLGLGWWHTRAAERAEQDFAEHVQD